MHDASIHAHTLDGSFVPALVFVPETVDRWQHLRVKNTRLVYNVVLETY
jgi:pentose-5-phosphate-3-epimerase